jgi:hypothetical protein
MLSLLALLPLSPLLGDRLGYYLVPLQAVIFARIPYLPIRANKAFYAAAPYLGLALVFIVWTYMSLLFYQCYVPYDSWLFGLPLSGMFRY